MAAAAGLHGLSAQAAIDRDNLIHRMVASMTMRQRIAQMFVIRAYYAEMTDWYAQMLEDIQPGGVIFFGDNIGSQEQVLAYIDGIHRSNPAIPPFVCVDQEGGPVTRVWGDPVPGEYEMGFLQDSDVVTLGTERAKYLKSFGFDVNLAPVADVAFTPNSFMEWRSFGSDPKAVGDKVHALITGSRQGQISLAAKHFPGHGRTVVDSHEMTPIIDISLNHWLETDAIPFKRAVDAGVDMIMMGHLWYTQWDDVPTSLSRQAVRVLRRQVGFKGPIITDDLIMGALSVYSGYEIVQRSLRAGADLLLYSYPPVSYQDLIASIEELAKQDPYIGRRINASCRRILTMKADRMGLVLPYPATPIEI